MTIALSFVAFALVASGCLIGLHTYRANATRPRTGLITQIGTGAQIQVRPRQELRLRAVTVGDTLSEGDTIITGAETSATITLFDGTTLALSGDSTLSFERLRASEYIGSRATIVVRQQKGRAIVTISAIPAFSQTAIDVMTQSGVVQAHQPATSFRVLVLPAAGTTGATTSVSVLSGTAITVASDTQTVTLHSGQQSVVAAGGVPSLPALKQRELVDNGAFQPGTDPQTQPASHWLRIDDDNNANGTVPAHMTIESVAIGDQTVDALHFVRTGNNADSYLIGVKQSLAYSQLDEFDSVILTADVKIVSHSLSAGGEQGTEYPVIFLLRYHDGKGNSVDKGIGIYTHDEASYPTNNGTVIGRAISADGGYTRITWDIKHLVPMPRELYEMRIYASGHDFDASIANISIMAK